MENEKSYAKTYGGKVGGLVPLIGMVPQLLSSVLREWDLLGISGERVS